MLRMDAKVWMRIKVEAQAACQPVRPLPLFGSDVMGRSLRDADSNLKAAGLREAVTLSKADILDIVPPAESAVLVMNPPYGVRLGEEEELAALYPKLGDVLKRNFANWRAYIISADANLPKPIRLSGEQEDAAFQRRAGMPALRIQAGGGFQPLAACLKQYPDGPGRSLSPCPKKQFAMLGPKTNTRFEVGINAKDLSGNARLLKQPKGGMCNYIVNLSEAKEVDGELVAWIKAAYDQAG